MLDECATNKLFFLGEQTFKQPNFSFPVYIIVFVKPKYYASQSYVCL